MMKSTDLVEETKLQISNAQPKNLLEKAVRERFIGPTNMSDVFESNSIDVPDHEFMAYVETPSAENDNGLHICAEEPLQEELSEK